MEHLNKFTLNTKVMYGSCDFTGRLGIFDTFKECMELAGIHSKLLGMPQDYLMKQGLFWLTVKTRILFNQSNMPIMGSPIKEETWPCKPLSLKTNRCYRLSNDNGIIAEGITEWAVLNLKENKLANVPSVFPKDMTFCEEELSFHTFPAIKICSNQTPVLGTYRVSSSDIDVGLHMNNAAYIRALLGFFSVEDRKRIKIRDFTAIFKRSAHEGDRLLVPIIKDGNTINTGLYFEDGSPAFLAQIITEEPL